MTKGLLRLTAAGAVAAVAFAPAASADTTGLAPDLGVYCALHLPHDTSGTFSYQFVGFITDMQQPTCDYYEISGGDAEFDGISSEGAFPAFVLPDDVPGDWGTACRDNYGPQSWAQETPGPEWSVTCVNADMTYYMTAQVQAEQNVR